MSIKKIENLNIHENPSTNQDEFDIENYLNANWNKIKDVVDNNADELVQMHEEYNKKETGQDKEIEELKTKDINQDNLIEELQEENKELKLENSLIKEQIPDGNIVGNSIHIEDSSNLEMSLRLNGGHKQETREGKNLLNIDFKDTTKNGVSVSYDKASGKIMLDGTASSSIALLNLGNFEYLKSKKYTGTFIFLSGSCTDYGAGFYLSHSEEKGTNTGGGAGFRTNTGRTFSINSLDVDTKLFGYITINSGTVFSKYTIQIQIIEGEEGDYNYEQYGEMPSSDYPSEIETVKDSVVVEVSSTETDYVPHQSQSITIPIQQEMLEGDYIDEVEHHEWGKIESYNGETVETEYISTTGELTTGAIIYYKLAEPLDLELTSEQKAIMEQKVYTYKNITNIDIDNELASLDVIYKKDIETEHNNLQKQIDEIKQLISETEAKEV